mmetsp:Transcript_2337/g.2695  ORF Transcript_2337/g.2695 Transcript_2337/m.2695 type:complete len:88 (-) Transcript_2337:176-439(-)
MSHTNISVVVDDGGSTLDDPSPPPQPGVFNQDGSLKRFGKMPSIRTMDHEYINENADPSTVSSVGGTLGSPRLTRGAQVSRSFRIQN